VSSISVDFTADQGAVLTDHFVNTAHVYHVDNDAIGATVPISGYIVGPVPYVLFLEGTQEQHQCFLKAMFKTTETFVLEFKGYDMYLYKTPVTKHATEPNKVTVTVASVP